jgi:hypothetical protein
MAIIIIMKQYIVTRLYNSVARKNDLYLIYTFDNGKNQKSGTWTQNKFQIKLI